MESTQKIGEINKTPPQPNPRTQIQSNGDITSFNDPSK
jgi:hypothetical protein